MFFSCSVILRIQLLTYIISSVPISSLQRENSFDFVCVSLSLFSNGTKIFPNGARSSNREQPSKFDWKRSSFIVLSVSVSALILLFSTLIWFRFGLCIVRDVSLYLIAEVAIIQHSLISPALLLRIAVSIPKWINKSTHARTHTYSLTHQWTSFRVYWNSFVLLIK